MTFHVLGKVVINPLESILVPAWLPTILILAVSGLGIAFLYLRWIRRWSYGTDRGMVLLLACSLTALLSIGLSLVFFLYFSTR